MINIKERIFSIVIKLITIASSMYGILVTCTLPMIFTYFTTLSNIAVIITAAMMLIADVIILVKKKDVRDNLMYSCKFLTTVSITLTFVAFMFLLAPTMGVGMWNAYFGGNASSFFLHFLSPVLAIIDFLVFDYKFKSNKKTPLISIIPPYIYVAYVIISAYCFNVRWGGMSAPYNFLNFGAETGWFGFDLSKLSWDTLGIGVAYNIVVLSLIFIGIGTIYLKLKDKRAKKIEAKNI